METPSKKKGTKNSKGLINICNRCIPHLNTDLSANPCDGSFGLFAKKCSRCATQRHACVAVEPPMFPSLNTTVRGREAHAKSLVDGDEEEQESTRAAAEEARRAMVEQLKAMHRNRNRITGDRTTPRKPRARAAPAGTNADTLLELQSLRRGVLALVEVGKLGLRHLGVDTAGVDNILGVDAPASEEHEEDEEEQEQEEGAKEDEPMNG
ncbi:hypothetical protein LTR85_001034 [Meristemomyces frigidus]|nr:hypothetical protein LTR85_001034 [Meristemomyces frigidus]